MLRAAFDEAFAADGVVDYDIAAAVVAYATGRLGADASAGVGPDGRMVPEGLVEPAPRALDVAVSEQSEWRMLWSSESDSLSEVQTVQRALTRSRPG